jgi:glycerophosphoryl diester phosphodiesterase
MNYEGLTMDYVTKCHQGGLKVSVWTPNDEQDILASLNAGVDSIASDRPDLVMQIIKKNGKL